MKLCKIYFLLILVFFGCHSLADDVKKTSGPGLTREIRNFDWEAMEEANLYFRRGKHFLMKGENALAVREFLKSRAITPSPIVSLNIALAHFEKKRYENAEPYCDEVIKLYETGEFIKDKIFYSLAYSLKAQILFSRGRIDQAIKCIGIAIKNAANKADRDGLKEIRRIYKEEKEKQQKGRGEQRNGKDKNNLNI